MPKKKNNKQKIKRLTRNLLTDKRAVSVALTTMIITAGVIAAGIAVLYWAYSWGNIANQEYSSTISSSQDQIGERLAFEHITYSDPTLTVNLINCGITRNVSITRIYVWDSSHQPIGTFTPNFPGLMYIENSTAIPSNSLNIGHDGYFKITVPGLTGYCSFRVVTDRGRNFDGTFTAP